MTISLVAPMRVTSNGSDTGVVVDSPDRGDWENYLVRNGARSLYHHWAWEEVFAVYGLSIVRLVVVRRGKITGVLPLVRQRSRIFGDRLVSLPWFDAAGVLADTEMDFRTLADAAVQKAELCGVRSIEIRQAKDVGLSPHVRTDKVLMRLALESDPRLLWERLKPKVRNQIRKGEKSGLSYCVGGEKLLPEFFHVYANNMRDLGSPSHSVRFFDAALNAFPDVARLHLVRIGSKVVGGALTLECGDIVEIPWASSLRRFNRLCVNHFLYWQILQKACSEGRDWFHFGRSTRGSGTYHFKRQWGAEDVVLHWYCLGKEATAAVGRSNKESFGWASALWKHLPVSVSRRLGPHVISKVS